MKILNFDQQGPEWLAWRKTVITGTDCPAIRGSSPWSTAYKCWQKKLDLIPEQEKSTPAMERGKRLEPEAREHFINKYGIPMIPRVVESTEFDFLGASLDGLSQENDCLLEIKCGGSKLHQMASRGEIPEYYKDQMQHQLLVTGASKCFYYSYDGDKDGICIEVFPDLEFRDKFLPLARAFWKCVALNEPPALQDSDYKDMSENPMWRLLTLEYRTICDQIKDLELAKEEYRKDILALCSDQNCSGNGIKVMKTVMRGRVAYDEITELKDINLDKYRKPSSTCWKILGA